MERKIILENGDKILKSLKIEDISVIKIDVEGAEAKVIEGLKETISDKRPFLIFEMLPFSQRNLKKDVFFNECKNLIQLIRSKDMTIFSILGNKDNSTKIIEFSDEDLSLEYTVTDFLAVPNELLNGFNKILEGQK